MSADDSADSSVPSGVREEECMKRSITCCIHIIQSPNNECVQVVGLNCLKTFEREMPLIIFEYNYGDEYFRILCCKSNAFNYLRNVK